MGEKILKRKVAMQQGGKEEKGQDAKGRGRERGEGGTIIGAKADGRRKRGKEVRILQVRLAEELEQKVCQTVTQEAASQHVEASELIELYRNNVIRKKLKTAKDLKCWERRRYYHRVLKSILCHYEFS